MLREQRVSAFPVLDVHNKVIGVVSESDLLTREALEGTVPGMPRSMMSQREQDPACFTVIVTDGIVTIEGAPETDQVGRDVIEAAGHIEGVVAVRDRLGYPQDTPDRPQLITEPKAL